MEMAIPQVIILGMILSSYLVAAEINCDTDRDYNVICSSGDQDDHVIHKEFITSNGTIINITLKDCLITDISEEAFKSIPTLKYLDLSRNKLSNLKVDMFNEQKELVHLNLSYNRITELPVLVFSKVIKLQVLDLRKNNLKILRLQTFASNHNLKYVDLAYNELKGENLDPLIFPVNSNIRHLDLSGNDLSNLHYNAFSWAERLEVLHLDACSLIEIPNLSKTNLGTIKHLTLAANRLTILVNEDTFQHLRSLEIVDLAENDIDIINERLFHSPDSLKTVILRKNKLKFLNGDTFRELSSLTNVDLSYNLFEQLPVDTFRWSSVKSLNLVGNRFTYLPENFISELRSVLVNLEKFYFHDNPWQCACLNDIFLEVKKFGIEYDSERFNGKKPVCVTGETYYFSCERKRDAIPNITRIYDKLIQDYNKLNNVTS